MHKYHCMEKVVWTLTKYWHTLPHRWRRWRFGHTPLCSCLYLCSWLPPHHRTYTEFSASSPLLTQKERKFYSSWRPTQDVWNTTRIINNRNIYEVGICVCKYKQISNVAARTFKAFLSQREAGTFFFFSLWSLNNYSSGFHLLLLLLLVWSCSDLTLPAGRPMSVRQTGLCDECLWVW